MSKLLIFENTKNKKTQVDSGKEKTTFDLFTSFFFLQLHNF